MGHGTGSCLEKEDMGTLKEGEREVHTVLLCKAIYVRCRFERLKRWIMLKR
jgi:hypothetical protein